MKVLYVKTNSERDKKYQLQTTIYEVDGEKFVKKKALCKEAIPHLMRMKESFTTLSESIVDPRIHLAKIVKEESDALTFEFINGTSMEEKILKAVKNGKEETIEKELERYIGLLKRGFKTSLTADIPFSTPEGKEIFNDIDLSKFDDTIYFDTISNIDLIFSNIIYRDDAIYLIDYEWVFKGSVPLKFALFRAFRSLYDISKLPIDNYFTGSELELFGKMERRLIFFEIMGANSFYQFREKFDKMRSNLYLKKSELEGEVSSLKNQVESLTNEVNDLENETLFYALSKSWKITRPMRKIFTYLRGLK